jgi:hypothetical protein
MKNYLLQYTTLENANYMVDPAKYNEICSTISFDGFGMPVYNCFSPANSLLGWLIPGLPLAWQ